jgi:hypothetical protein
MAGGEGVLRRIPGEGWLVLAASMPELGGPTADLMERLLERLDLSRPIAAIAAPDSDTDQVNEFLETLEEWLGTEVGYLELDSDLETEGWETSGMLLLVGEDPELWIESLERGAGERLRSALSRGALVVAVGGAGSALGEQAVAALRPGELVSGLGWMPGSLLLQEPEDAGLRAVKAWLQSEEPRYALHLHPGSILAFGPDNQVERWGEPAPEVVLGSGWARQ